MVVKDMLYIRPPRSVAEAMVQPSQPLRRSRQRKRLAEIHLSEKDVDVYGDGG